VDEATGLTFKPVSWHGAVAVMERSVLRIGDSYFGFDGLTETGDIAEFMRDLDASRFDRPLRPAARRTPPPSRPTASTTGRPNDGTLVGPIEGRWLLITVFAGLAVYCLTAGVGGFAFQWRCDDYAEQRALDRLADGRAPFLSYQFTGFVVGYCEPQR